MNKFLNCLKYAAILMLPVLLGQSCSDDDSPSDDVRPPLFLQSGQATKSVESEAGPKKGQKERSSDNFSTQNMGEGTSIYWTVPEGVSFDVKIDKTAASDPFYANEITNGSITPYKSESKMYIANPKGATEKFQIQYTVFTPEDGVLYVLSAKDHMSGQSHRASSNFHFPNSNLSFKIECPEGVTFSIMKDVSAGSDEVMYSNLKNGDVITRTSAGYNYIADANGAETSFMIAFIPEEEYEWMSKLSDNLNLYELSIPGTHDSGTKEVAINYAVCQFFTIAEQLSAGIRFFDIRLDGNLNLSHGGTDCHVSFTQVLDWCDDFLTAHPKETIIMRVKEEDGSISDKIKNYFADPSNQKRVSRFLRDTKLHKLGECRGKIVMLREFPEPDAGGPWGIPLTKGWPHDGSGTFTTPDGVNFYVEDRYFSASEVTHDTMNKKQHLEDAFKALDNTQYKDYLFLLFNSIAMRITTFPYHYAWGGSTCDRPMMPILSDLLYEYFEKDKTGTQRAGILILDFYNNRGYDDDLYLVQRIINLNFKDDLIPHPTPRH